MDEKAMGIPLLALEVSPLPKDMTLVLSAYSQVKDRRDNM